MLCHLPLRVDPAFCVFAFASCSTLLLAPELGAATPAVPITASTDKVRVELDRELFTEHLLRAAARPFLHPVRLGEGR